jgi:hypothetical protein
MSSDQPLGKTVRVSVSPFQCPSFPAVPCPGKTLVARLGMLVLLLGAAPVSVSLPEKYPGPDDPATLAAAREALGRAKVLDVVGISRGIEGVLRDLGAKVTDRETVSERRAQSVKAWLVGHGGVSGATITTRGWGKTRPVVPNTHPDGSDDPDGREKNRRVEVTVRTR